MHARKPIGRTRAAPSHYSALYNRVHAHKNTLIMQLRYASTLCHCRPVSVRTRNANVRRAPGAGGGAPGQGGRARRWCTFLA